KARLRWQAQLSIEHNAQQAPAPGQATPIGKQRIIRKNRPDSGKQCVRRVAHAMIFRARLFGSDPFGSSTLAGVFCGFLLQLRQGELSVERKRGFERDEGLLRSNPAGKRLVQAARLFLANVRNYFYAGQAKPLEASAGIERIPILDRGDNAFYSGCDDGFGTRSGTAGAAAGLEGDVERGA